MYEFRVALQILSRLEELQSERLQVVSSLGSAITELVDEYKRLRDWLRERDYRGLKSQFQAANAYIDEESIAHLDDEEWEKTAKLGCEVENYSLSYERLNDVTFTLQALDFLVRSYDRDAILTALRDEDWFVQHEILTRWGWILSHRELLSRGETLHRPFRCIGPKRNSPGRNVDREFYSLLRFLRGLSVQSGRKLLFKRRRMAGSEQPPDFELEEVLTGTLIGAEMSEIPLSQDWADERDAEARVWEALRPLAREHGLVFHIFDPENWHALADRLDTLCDWVLREISFRESSIEPTLLVHQELGVRIQVRQPDGDEGPHLSASDPAGSTGNELRALEKQLVEAFHQRIRRKLFRNGQPRQPPGVRPCYLVLYPNYGFPSDIDLDAVISRVRGRIDFDPSTHFDEVWVSTEVFISQVV